MEEETMWTAEFGAKALASGMFAPLVKLSRSAGDGPRGSSLTYEGAYPTEQAAINAARRHYTGQDAED